MATVNPLPAAIRVAETPFTFVATREQTPDVHVEVPEKSPVPSSPWTFEPQHHTSPVDVSPHACAAPAETLVTAGMLGIGTTGVGVLPGLTALAVEPQATAAPFE
jgi:hypothetical protein